MRSNTTGCEADDVQEDHRGPATTTTAITITITITTTTTSRLT
jgi:hypothetical protein